MMVVSFFLTGLLDTADLSFLVSECLVEPVIRKKPTIMVPPLVIIHKTLSH